MVDANQFQGILSSLNETTKYIDKFDVLSLTSIDVNSKEAPTDKIPLPGFKKLLEDIYGIMNSCNISHQSSITSLEFKINSWEKQMPTLHHVSSDENGNPNEWNSIPIASDEVNTQNIFYPPSYYQHLEKVDMQGLASFLHHSYHEAKEMHETKLFCLDLLIKIFEIYCEKMTKYAKECNILNPEARLLILVQPHYSQVSNHKYLNTEDVQKVSQRIVTLWAIAFERGNKISAEAILTNDFYKKKHSQAKEAPVNWTAVKLGIAAVLMLWSLSECYNNQNWGEGGDAWKDPSFALFICLGDMTLLLWLWGVSISVWGVCDIDYVSILQLQSTDLIINSNNAPEVDRNQSDSFLSRKGTTFPPSTLNKTSNKFKSKKGNSETMSRFFITLKQNVIHSLNTNKAAFIVFSSALDFTIIHLVSFIMFSKVLRGVFSTEAKPAIAHIFPSGLVLYFLYKIFYPWNSRRLWLMMLRDVIAAPLYPVHFRDGYLGDILTSTVRVSINMLYSISYMGIIIYSWTFNDLHYANSVTINQFWWERSFLSSVCVPFLTLFPGWVRLMQCLRRSLETNQRWPHYFNALKYTSALTVVAFGVFRPHIQDNTFWLLGLLSATIYQLIWDITMDWGLVSLSSTTGFQFRTIRLLGPIWVYVAIFVLNLILRFSWAVVLLPESMSAFSVLTSFATMDLQTFMAAAEIVRRMVWGFVRLEWEQVEKYGGPMSDTMSDSAISSMTLKPDEKEKEFFDSDEEEQQTVDSNVLPKSKFSEIEIMDLRTGLKPENSSGGARISTSFEGKQSKNTLNSLFDDEFHWLLLIPGVSSYFNENDSSGYRSGHSRSKGSGSAWGSSLLWFERLIEAIFLAGFVVFVITFAAFP